MHELATTIEEIQACLAAEQRAIVALDGTAIEELTNRKEMLAHRLGTLLSSSSPHDRLQFRDPLLQLQHSAEINRLLLSDALDVMATFVGHGDESGTYDERAVIQRNTTGCIDVGA